MDKIESFLDEQPAGFLFVCIGASAGGIQALKEFFQHVPTDSRLGYVVILHLPPDYDSKLAEVLQATTTIGVQQITGKVKLETDNVYVVPPNQHLVLQDGFIVPTENVRAEERRAPVDIFFGAWRKLTVPGRFLSFYPAPAPMVLWGSNA
nr:chemotaxis protein CheB [Segetibacter sp. 3557_3]